MTENLQEEVEYEIFPDRQFVTDASLKMIAAWLREKRPDDYERLLRGGTFDKLASLREARTTSGIIVEFRLKVNSIDESKTATYPAFWKREDNILIYSAEPKKHQIAKAIAKALISNQTYKDLAHWVEVYWKC